MATRESPEGKLKQLPKGANNLKLAPGIILPTQYEEGRTKRYGNFHRLLLALLENAILAVERGDRSTLPKVGRNRDEAISWIGSEDMEWPYSFLNVLYYLDIEPTWFRKRFRERRAEGSLKKWIIHLRKGAQ